MSINWTAVVVAGTYLADRHLVGGESSSFVGADDRGATQGLHRRQTAHDGVLLGHASGSQGEAGGDNSRKSLRNGRHCQRHRDLEVVDGTLDPRAPVSGVVEVTDVDSPHRDTDERDNLHTKPSSPHVSKSDHVSYIHPERPWWEYFIKK